MRHYIGILGSLMKLSLKRVLENRANTFGSVMSSLTALFLSLFFISIIFSYSSSVAGWSKYEVFLLTGIFKLVRSLFYFLFKRSVDMIPDYIRNGDLDLLLVKPFNSQFFLSFRNTRIYDLISCLEGMGLIAYSVYKLGFNYSIFTWLLLIVNIFLGTIILYAIYFSLATLSIWFGRFTALQELFFVIREPLSLPVSFYGRSLSLVLTSILPLAFIVSVPAELFLNKAPIYYFGLEIIVTLLVLAFSVWFWNISLKHYTSASS